MTPNNTQHNKPRAVKMGVTVSVDTWRNQDSCTHDDLERRKEDKGSKIFIEAPQRKCPGHQNDCVMLEL